MILREAEARPAGAAQDDRRQEPPREAALWADFGAPSSAGGFYRSWLAIQCGFVARAVAGALLVDEDEGRYAVAATWPDGSRDVGDLAAAAGPALKERRGIVHYPPEKAGQPNSACIAYPVDIDGRLRAVVVVQIPVGSATDLQSTVR